MTQPDQSECSNPPDFSDWFGGGPVRIYPGTFAGIIGKKTVSYLESIINGMHVGATGVTLL